MTCTPTTVVGVALASRGMTVAVYDSQARAVDVIMDEVAIPGSSELQVISQVEQAVTEAGKRVGKVTAVGLSIGGHISEDGKSVRFAPGVVAPGRDWLNVPIVDLLERALGVPAIVENDVNCLCAYERTFGPAEGVDDFIVVYLAPDVEGLGCGIVAGGELIRGATGGAGEFGHIVIHPEGPTCRCGNRGCLEAMLAVENFDRNMNWGRQSNSSGFSEAAALVGSPDDHRAARTFHRSGGYLGQGLATAVNLLNPKLIILGGPPELISGEVGVGTSSELFMQGLQQALAANAFSSMGDDCEVLIDRLSLGMAASGAAILMEHHMANRAPGQE